MERSIAARAARWDAAEALVTRARDKGVSRLDTEDVAAALGLDDTSDLDEDAPGPDEGGDGSHPFEAEHQAESDAKRRLPRCKECGGQADNTLHDGDQRESTRHYRMLLRAIAASKTPAAVS